MNEGSITFKMAEEFEKNYMNNASGELENPQKTKEPSLSDLTEEIHGPVTEVITNYSRSGMAVGDYTYIEKHLRWQQDGSLLIQTQIVDHGINEDTEIKVESEVAAKLRTYIAENHIAEMAQIQSEPKPFVPDLSVTENLSVYFDDSSIGGSARVKRTLDCTIRCELLSSAVSEIERLIKECENSGTVISNEESSTTFSKGMNNFLQGGPKWKCECGQENTGMYCSNCGLPAKHN